MTFDIGGIGTIFYGARWRPDGTHITTKWFIFVYVPIVPIRSVRVIKGGRIRGVSASYSEPQAVETVPLDIPMVLKVYATAAAVIAGVVGAIALLNWYGRGS